MGAFELQATLLAEILLAEIFLVVCLSSLFLQYDAALGERHLSSSTVCRT